MAITKTGMVAGSPQSLNDLVDKINALPATGFAKVANQAASTATDVAGLKTDFNALLAKLKTAGIMTAD